MARYKCPCCGEPYNGKVCRSCFYENFSNETSCKEHHKEVVFDREPSTRKQNYQTFTKEKTFAEKKTFAGDIPKAAAPRPYVTTSANSRTNSGSKKKTPAKGVVKIFAIIYGIVILVNAASGLFFAGLRNATSRSFDALDSLIEPEPEVTMPAGGTVLYDDGTLLVRADWENGDPYTGDIPVYIQNNTDQNLRVSARDIIVNDYVMDSSHLYCYVDEDCTAMAYLRLDEEDLADSGIDTVSEISFSLYSYNSDSYESYIQTDTITLTAAVSPDFVQPVDDSGVLLWEGDGIKVVCKGYKPSDYSENYLDGTVLFYIENTTDRYLQVRTPEFLVNQEISDLSLWCELPPNTRAVADLYLFDLKNLNIDSADDVLSAELTLEFGDRNSWEFEILSDPISLDIT